MPLTDAWIRAAKPRDKVYKQADAGGLYIEVTTVGNKAWRLAYRYAGKQKTLSLGSYPLIGLAEARQERDAAKKLLLKGIDPAEARRTQAVEAENSFEAVARAWHQWKSKSLTSSRYKQQIMDRLEANVFPEIGARAIDQIEPPMVLAMLRKIEERGAVTMAARVREHCSEIFRYALFESKCARDPCADLRGGLLPPPPVKHHRVVRFDELPRLLRDIDAYHDIGDDTTRIGLQLAMLTLVRTGELIKGEWTQVQGLDGERPLWVIPDPQMKMKGRDGHIVPLSRQAAARFRELREITGRGGLMFPGEKPGRHISNNTLLFALYRMGYRSRQTTHGFRRIASTLLNEAKYFRPDVIEKQLAHEEKNKSRRAYNAAEYLDERIPMLQWWADYLDAMKAGAPKPPCPDALTQPFLAAVR
jgi:integrase